MKTQNLGASQDYYNSLTNIMQKYQKNNANIANNYNEKFKVSEDEHVAQNNSSPQISSHSLHLIEQQAAEFRQAKQQYELGIIREAYSSFAPDSTPPATYAEITDRDRAVLALTQDISTQTYGNLVAFIGGAMDFSNIEKQALDMALRKNFYEDYYSDDAIRQRIDDLGISKDDKQFFYDIAKKAAKTHMNKINSNFDEAIDFLSQNEASKACDNLLTIKGILDKDELNELKNQLKNVFNEMLEYASKYIKDKGYGLRPEDGTLLMLKNDKSIDTLKQFGKDIKTQIMINGVNYDSWGQLNNKLRNDGVNDVQVENHTRKHLQMPTNFKTNSLLTVAALEDAYSQGTPLTIDDIEWIRKGFANISLKV